MVAEAGLTHLVASGDSIESIAFLYGHFGPTIWDHPQNKKLKNERVNPDVLCPGDEVFVPPLRQRSETFRTGAKYRFRRRGVPSKIYFFARVFGLALANEPFVVEVDGRRIEGETTEDGLVECFVTPNAESAKVTIGEGESTRVYLLRLRMVQSLPRLPDMQPGIQEELLRHDASHRSGELWRPPDAGRDSGEGV